MSGNTVLRRPSTVLDDDVVPTTSMTTQEMDDWVRDVLGVSIDDYNKESSARRRPKPSVDLVAVTDGALNQALVTNAMLATATDNTDVEALRDILKIHTDAVPKEATVFRQGRLSIEHVDDLAQIQKPEDRQKKVDGIKDVLNAVALRRTDMLQALNAVEAIAVKSDEVKEALKIGWATYTQITSHLPNYFRDQYVEKELQRRLKTIASTPQEKAILLEKAKQGFVDPDGNPVLDANGKPVGDGLRATFKDAIEKIGTRDFDRQNFYFDAVTTAITPEDGEKLYAANDHLVEQGQLIMDCGGNLRDVQLMLAKTGVPEDWWPPRLVESLQAWRKVERALQEERVSEMVAKKKPDFATTEGIMTFFLSEMPELGSSCLEFFEDNAVAKAVKDLLEGIKQGFDTGAVGFEALKLLDFDELEPTTRQKLLDGIEKSMSTLEKALDSASSAMEIATSMGAQHLAAVIPGLSIAACGVNLALAIKKLGEHTVIKVQTKLMNNEAFKALGNADITDGGAFVQALGNEINGRNKQLTKDGIEVTTSGMDLAGSIAGTVGGHFGLAAQAGLKITSTGITYGTKVVFTNIDWSEADRAKKLLSEARAGNPVARMQIFKESNLYAKMYICTLCRDKVSLALKFIDQRGIEEGDLNTPMSLKILREALLDSADQKDEGDIDDSRLMENLGKVGKFGMFVSKKAKAVGGSIKEVTRDRKVAYTAIPLPFDAASALTEASWDETKRIAVRGGLYDGETGIGDALSDFEEAMAEIAPTILAGTVMDPTTKPGRAMQGNFLVALDALMTVQGALDRFRPGCNPDGKAPHPEMVGHVAAMLKTARAKYVALETTMSDLGLKDAGWSPSSGGAPLDAAAWETSWKEGMVHACLPESDGGMADALKAVAKAEQEIIAAKDLIQKRAARIRAVEALNDLIGAAKQCWAQARGVPAMLDRVDKVLKAAGPRRVELDQELAPKTWTGMPKVDAPADVTVAKWTIFWTSAVKAGMCLDFDGGVLAAFRELEMRAATVSTAAMGKPLLKARQDFGIAVGKVIIAVQKLVTLQRDLSQPIRDYLQNIQLSAIQQQKNMSEARDGLSFLAEGGATVAGWTKTYANAVDSGVLPPAKAGAKAYKEALEAYETAFPKMLTAVKAKKFGDALKQAAAAKKGLLEADKAIFQKLQAADGYASNAKMGPYLERMRKEIAVLLAAKPLTDALAGVAAGSNFVAGPFTLDAKAFGKIKESAEKNGVIVETKTGVGGALEKCTKSLAALSNANTASITDHDKIDKARLAAVTDAKELVEVVGKLAALAPLSVAWQGYSKQALVFARAHAENVAKRTN